MHTGMRPYSGASDQDAMLALAQSSFHDTLHVVDLPYRLCSWVFDEPANAALWEDESGRLLAWAVLQAPFWTIDYACRPGAEADLHRVILEWADGRAREALSSAYARPCWFVMAFADQVQRGRELQEAGFASQADVGENSWSKVWMARPAQIEVTGESMPAGFSVRPLSGEREVEPYVALHREVFESKNMTAEWRTRTLRRPEYRPDLDLLALDPDGRPAAFCIAWLGAGAQGEPAGQIEPLGVRADYRGLGLGRAILAENLRRLQACGARQVYVETDNYRNAALGTYYSAGFRVLRDVLVYRKDYADSRG